MGSVVNRIIPQRKSTGWNEDINSSESRIVRFDISLITDTTIFSMTLLVLDKSVGDDINQFIAHECMRSRNEK